VGCDDSMHRGTAIDDGLCGELAHQYSFSAGGGEAIIYPAANQFVAQWVPFRERRLYQRPDLFRVGRREWIDTAATQLADRTLWLEERLSGFSAGLGLAVGIAWWFMAREPARRAPIGSR